MLDCRHAAFAGFFLAGVGIGAGVALLLAPKSGRETRRLISRKTEDGMDFVAAKGRGLRRQAEDTLERGKELASRLTH